MSDSTGIEWTDTTWNPVRGCSKKSPGCLNCYAIRQALRQAGPGGAYEGLVRMEGGKPNWTGKVVLVPEKLEEPLHWRKPRLCFVNSMSDLFHETLPNQDIDRVFGTMALARDHTFQILTKRPARMRRYFAPGQFRDVYVGDAALRLRPDAPIKPTMMKPWPLPNVWLGTSVEDQQRADERIPELVATPAAVRFLSVEPMLGPMDLLATPAGDVLGECEGCADSGKQDDGSTCAMCMGLGRIGWVIVGGESGPGARPFDPEWARSIVTQCRESGVPVFVKQMGSRWAFKNVPRHADGHADTKGGSMDKWPEDLRIREFPAAYARREVRHV